jgi:restriction system protein
VARRRGFFAELQHQAQVAEKRRQQEARAATRAQSAALRDAEQALRQAERAEAQAARATAAEQKATEREARRLHEEAMLAEVEVRNAQLAVVYDEIDSLLAATLDVDDYVDLAELRQTVEHPPFDRPDLERPTLPPPPIVAPPEPVYVAPEGAPRGLGGVFGGKKKYAQLVADAEAAHAAAHEEWRHRVAEIPALQLRQEQAHEIAERRRLELLAEARREYEAECEKREATVRQVNQDLDELISGLAYNTEDAVQEYVAIVLGNSVYPDSFPVGHEFRFDSRLRELVLTVTVPGPRDVPGNKAYRYSKANDEITSSQLTQKEQRERYTNAVAHVALRTLHEVFEADREARIQTIALSVVSNNVDPATGRQTVTPLVAVAADRETFASFDLSNVLPLATLQHMNALVSKNPFQLVPIDTSRGVRG